jgi:hypothetical protein
MKIKNYKKKNDLHKINKFFHQEIEKLKKSKTRFSHLKKTRPTSIYKIKKNPKRSDLKQEINNYLKKEKYK